MRTQKKKNPGLSFVLSPLHPALTSWNTKPTFLFAPGTHDFPFPSVKYVKHTMLLMSMLNSLNDFPLGKINTKIRELV